MPDRRSDSPSERGSRPGTDFDQLVARYLPRLHAYVRVNMGPGLRRHEASVDLVQSVCREVLEDRDAFEFQGEGQFVRWLLTAAMNKLRERARFFGRQKRDPAREQPLQVGDRDRAVYHGLSPSGELMGQEEIARVEAALDELPDDYREVVVLARLIGLPNSEIATHLDRTEAAVRALLGRALARLGRKLG